MKTVNWRLVVSILAVTQCAAVWAQAPAQPAVAFPATPTPQPKAPPFTPAELDTHLVPTQFLSRTSDVLAIAYNGFRRSQIDPCGCVTNQLGGLDKEARLLARTEELNIPLVKIDAGGFIKDTPDAKSLEQSRYLLKGLGAIGYDAVNVGFTDLALTPAQLKAAASEAGVKLISANVVDESGAALFDPYVIKDVKLTDGSTVKVGILGVTRPRIELSADVNAPSTSVKSGTGDASQNVVILNPIMTINKHLAELADQTDLVMIAYYDRRSKAEPIVAALNDSAAVDVLIFGENNQIQGTVQALNGVQVVSGGYEGRQVGTLYVELKDKEITSTWGKHIEVVQMITPLPSITGIMEQAHAAVQAAQPTPPATPAGSPAPTQPLRLDLSAD